MYCSVKGEKGDRHIRGHDTYSYPCPLYLSLHVYTSRHVIYQKNTRMTRMGYSDL